MFIEQADKTTLRQGDIIQDIWFTHVPLDEPLQLSGTYLSESQGEAKLRGTSKKIGRTDWLTGQGYFVRTPCAVLSQDCDVDRRQQSPPPTLVVCRVKQIPESLRRKEELFSILKQNVDPYGATRAFFPLFYIPQTGPLDQEYVADFSQVMSIGWKDYDRLLLRKALEMDDLHRSKFRVKAGAFFGRPTAEEVKSGIANPWQQSEAGV